MIKQITSFLIYFVFIIKINAQVPATFNWNSYSCPSTATANSYTYSQTVSGVTMNAAVYYSGTAANIGWTNAISTCSFRSPAYNSNYLGVTTGGLVLSTDRASSGSAAPTPTVSLVFSPALCGSVTFSIGDINGADFNFRDSIRVNAWDGNNNPITMLPGMVTRGGGSSYPPFVNLSTNLIVYGNGFYDGTVDVFTISAATAAKISKINIIYYSGKKDYSGNTITNPSEQHIIISGIKGNVPPTVGATFACNTNSTSVNLIGSASNTTTTPTASTYTWTTTTGTINSGSNALTANVKSPGTYTLTAYNGAVSAGCSTQTVISLSSVNCSLLPIELTDFYASLRDKNVILNWETYTELNSNYFIVERSSDGIEFEPLTKLQASKNSNQFKQYQFFDENPFPKINYYRLKLVDADGSSRYSRIIDITLETEKIVVNNIKPNPAQDFIHFDIHSSKKLEAEIALIDFTGLQVLNETRTIEEGKSTEHINISDLAQGVYILKISSPNAELKSYTKIIKH